MDKLLFTDTETGGLNPEKHSLLSVAFIVWDGKELQKDNFYIKQKNYNCTDEALKINNINLKTISENSVSKRYIIEYIREIKSLYFGGKKITLAGQNVNFDCGFLKKLYEEENEDYLSDFNYRVLDVSSVLKFMYIAKKIPSDISSLDAAINYFGISMGLRHSAMSDCEATLEVFKKLLALSGASDRK